MKVFLNDRLMDASGARQAAAIDPTDRGLTLGDGVFETMAVRGGQIPRADAHLARLGRGASVLGIELPMAGEDLLEALKSVIAANAISDGAVRLTCTRGPGPRGLLPPQTPSPSLIITGAGTPLGLGEPVSAIIATETRRNEHSPLSRIKSLNYLDNVLALGEAVAKGADDALMLNGAGNLACATSANVFAVIGGNLVTPPVQDGCLDGVLRADVLGALGGEERTLAPGDLAGASEAFLTNCFSVRPLIMVDGQQIGNGKPGPITGRAQKRV
ncbi:MAG: aminotransferase class IV [Rhodospirillales bacterium]|nr:aminotransferase class IV [Alphaproteobacteria bacterium]MBL6948375.1 aminotransferase class IV [Rhodospirillales bacterium]